MITKVCLIELFVMGLFLFRNNGGCCEGFMLNETIGECTGKLISIQNTCLFFLQHLINSF